MVTVIAWLLLAAILLWGLIESERPPRRGGCYVIETDGMPDGYIPPSASLDPPKDFDG